ncbi:MAG: hypothetical protein ABIV26_00550, partial [Candidatus Limnocylindrales bacterium]
NIGPAEITRRRRSAVGVTSFTVIIAIAIVAAGLPQLARLAIFPFAAASAVSWLQVIRRFCVGFAAAGIQNFGALGAQERIADDAARAADRRRASLMTLEGAAYAAIVTGILVVLPI